MVLNKVVVLPLAIAFCGLVPHTTGAREPVTEVVLNQVKSFILAPDIVSLFDFQLICLRRRNVINGSFAYSRVVNTLNLKILLDFVRPDKTRFHILELTTDGCHLMSGNVGKQNFVKVIMQELAKQKHLPQKCPLEANKTYSLENYAVELPKFPFPNLKFEALIELYDELNVRKLCEIRVKGATKRKT